MSDLSRRLETTAVYQRFSLPGNLVFYMSKNSPSPKVYNKLIKCCKYFGSKNSVITLKDLYLRWRSKCWATIQRTGFQESRNFTIENLNENLWIYRDLTIGKDEDHFLASSLIPKIYRCNLILLSLSFQIISFDEFKKFTSSESLEELYLEKTTVKNDDGSIVPIEKLIELLPNLQELRYYNVSIDDGGLQTITSETAANLVAIPHFPKMKFLYIYEIDESFDIEAFFATPKVNTFMFNYLPD